MIKHVWERKYGALDKVYFIKCERCSSTRWCRKSELDAAKLEFLQSGDCNMELVHWVLKE